MSKVKNWNVLFHNVFPIRRFILHMYMMSQIIKQATNFLGQENTSDSPFYWVENKMWGYFRGDVLLWENGKIVITYDIFSCVYKVYVKVKLRWYVYTRTIFTQYWIQVGAWTGLVGRAFSFLLLVLDWNPWHLT